MIIHDQRNILTCLPSLSVPKIVVVLLVKYQAYTPRQYRLAPKLTNALILSTASKHAQCMSSIGVICAVLCHPLITTEPAKAYKVRNNHT